MSSIYKPDIRISANNEISESDLSALNEKIENLLTDFSQEQSEKGISTDISWSWYEKKELY